MNININPSILPFYLEEKTRELCKDCKRYGKSGSCPPFLKDIKFFERIFLSYPFGILIVKKFNIDDPKNWKELGRKSSETIRKEIKKLEKTIKATDYVSYGAGSCKNCKICSPICKFPDKRLIPLEGTGINVVKLFYDLTEIELKFPVEKQGYFYRIGLFLYEK
jgi:predicted metal-binding protein